MNAPKNPLLLIILTLALSACSHGPKAPDSQEHPELADSGIEICYGLGHTHRKIVLVSKGSEITGQTYLDRQILREGQIDASRYNGFFQKASEILNKTQRNPASDLSACRNPFTLTIRVKSE